MKSLSWVLAVVFAFSSGSAPAFAQEAPKTQPPTTVVSVVAVAKEKKTRSRLTGRQKKQLYWQGAITDSNGQVWEVSLIPGVTGTGDQVKRGAVHTWDAGKAIKRNLYNDAIKDDLGNYLEASYWNTYGTFNRATWGFVKDQGPDFKKHMGEAWNLPLYDFMDDVRGKKANYDADQKKLEARKGELGTWVSGLWNKLRLGVGVVKEVIEVPLEMGVRTGYALGADVIPAAVAGVIVFPVGNAVIFVTPPTLATLEALDSVRIATQLLVWNIAAQTVVAPGAMIVWTQPAWLMSAFENEPTTEARFVYKVVSLKDRTKIYEGGGDMDRPKPEVRTYRLTEESLNSVILMTIAQAQAQPELDRLKAQIDALNAKLDALTRERDASRAAMVEARSKRGTEVAAGQNEQRAASDAQVKETAPAVAEKIASDQVLAEKIEALAKKLGVELSPEAIAQLVKQTRVTVEQMMKP